MTEPLGPNPFSPYATADPAFRHLFPTPVFFPEPLPGALTFTACSTLAVVPAEPLQEFGGETEELPDGLCPGCVAAMHGHAPAPTAAATTCRGCDALTSHNGLCALCRQADHHVWRRFQAEAPHIVPGRRFRSLRPDTDLVIVVADHPVHGVDRVRVTDTTGQPLRSVHLRRLRPRATDQAGRLLRTGYAPAD